MPEVRKVRTLKQVQLDAKELTLRRLREDNTFVFAKDREEQSNQLNAEIDKKIEAKIDSEAKAEKVIEGKVPSSPQNKAAEDRAKKDKK